MIGMLGEMRQRVLHVPQEERKDEEGTSLTTLCSFSFGRLASPTLYTVYKYVYEDV